MKIIHHFKNQENLNLNEKIQSTNTDFEKMQKLELCDKEI